MSDISVRVKLDARTARQRLGELNKSATEVDQAFKNIKLSFERFTSAAQSLDKQRATAFRNNLKVMRSDLENFTSAARSLDKQRADSFKSNLRKMRSDLESFASAAKSLDQQRTSTIEAEYRKWLSANKKRINAEVKDSSNAFQSKLKMIKNEGAAKNREEQKALNNKLKSLNEQLKATRTAAQQEEAAWRRSIQNTIKMRRQAAAANARLKQAGVQRANVAALNEFNAQANAMINLKRQAANAKSSVGLLSKGFKTLASAIPAARIAMIAFNTAAGASLIAIGKVIHATNILNASFESSRNAMMAAVGSQTVANREMQHVVDLANKYKLDLVTLTKQYSKFSISAQLAGMSNTEVKNSFEAVSKAVRVLNLNTQQQDRVFLALEQMASKSTVMMEELKRQLGDVLPGAVQVGARAMGYGAGEMGKFFKAVRDGTVKSAEFIPKFAEELDKLYSPAVGEALNKYTAKLQGVSNEWTRLKANIGEGSRPIAEAFAGSLEYMLAKVNDFADAMQEKTGLHVATDKSVDKFSEFQQAIFDVADTAKTSLNKLKANGVNVDEFLPDYKDAVTGLEAIGPSVESLTKKIRALNEVGGLDAESFWDYSEFRRIAEQVGLFTREQLADMDPKEYIEAVVEAAANKLPELQEEFDKTKAEGERWMALLKKLPSASKQASVSSEELATKIESLKNESQEYIDGIDLTKIQQEIELTKLSGAAKEQQSFLFERHNGLMELTNKLAKENTTNIQEEINKYEEQTRVLAAANDELYQLNEEKERAEELSKTYASALEKEAAALLDSSGKFKNFASQLRDLLPKDASKEAKITSFQLAGLASEFRKLAKNGDVAAAESKMEEFQEAAEKVDFSKMGKFESGGFKRIIEDMARASEQFSQKLKEKGDEINIAIKGPTEEAAMKAAEDAKNLVQKFLSTSQVEFSALLKTENITTPDGKVISYDDLLNNKTWYHTVQVSYVTNGDVPPGVGGGNSTVKVNKGSESTTSSSGNRKEVAASAPSAGRNSYSYA